MRRRSFLTLPLLGLVRPAHAQPDYPVVVPRRPLRFPRDHGAHPEYRTEWWYITGWLGEGRLVRGFQVTFFRSRPGVNESGRSRFAPRQLLFAHAALADPAEGRLLHDQRAARVGQGLARFDEADTALRIDDWQLERTGGAYRAHIPGRELTLSLTIEPTQPLLLQGEDGFSRKGPRMEQASYYYSWPHLRVKGSVQGAGRREDVTGTAWLDHEWSSEVLAAEAVGWDWIGANLDDGGALMAFRIRGRDGSVVWAGGSRRSARGGLRVFSPEEVSFEPRRTWRSPRTGATYPVACRLATAEERWEIEPLFEDQELDARASTGTVYWEGAATVRSEQRTVGRGYLELTGYVRPLRL